MYKIFFFLIILSKLTFGASYEIELIPKEPIVGESFNIIFKINSNEGSDPRINFTPSGIEILSKEETGTSTTTTFINGTLTTSRTISVTYEAVASKTGFAYLRDINVDIGTNNLKGKNKRIRILKEPKRERDIFIRAEVDKDDVFVNESIIVRYYLYSRLRVLSIDIKKFPSLDKFLKRFHQESQGVERVQLNNGIYERRIIYSSQLFSNRPGVVKVDPISVSVAYAQRRRSNNPFSNFGIGGLSTKKRSLKSKKLEINIKALPNQTPQGFTGLVGEHDVSFKINKSKFLVNEPIEINLSIKGTGALELYEEPKFFNSSKVEEFDTTSDFVVNKDFSAQKSFKITYLAREAGSIEAQEKKLVFFDPIALKFIEKIIKIPSIIIAETAISSSQVKKNKKQKRGNVLTNENNILEKSPLNLNPLYSFKNTLVYNKLSIIIVILLLVLTIMLVKIIKLVSASFKNQQLDLYQSAIKSGVNYSMFYDLISAIGKGSSLKDIIKESNLTEKEKEILLDYLDKFNKAFEQNKKLKIKLNRKLVEKLKVHRLEY